MKDAIKSFVKGLGVQHYVVLAVLLAIGIFNAVTGLAPVIKQHNRESSIEKIFKEWWETEGAEQIKAVGLVPDETIRQEKYESFRNSYLQQNHTFIVEDRLEEMKVEFREWWEIRGGKQQYMEDHNNVYPTEKDFQREWKAWAKNYTNKHLRYSLAYVPEDEDYGKLFTSWLLFPGFFSFIIFAPLFFFAFKKMNRRWATPVLVGIIVVTMLLGGIVITALTGTSFFDHYVTERYMGMSFTLAFLLGAVSFSKKQNDTSNVIKGVAVAGLLLDMILNWFAYPGIFGAVTVASPIAFGLGAVAGLQVPARKKSMKEAKAEALEERLRQNAARNPLAERKAKTREMIDDGFRAASQGAFDKAQGILSQGITALLQEHPIDAEAVKSLAEKMTNPSLFIEIESAQWIQWGEMAKSKASYEAALLLLEKGLSIEASVSFARRTLYNIGEIRVNQNIAMDEGIARLKKVIELGDKDILAAQARKLLNKIGVDPVGTEESEGSEESESSEN